MVLKTNFLVIAWMLVTLPAAAAPLGFEQYALPNGLNVILHEDHALPLVCVNLWYRAGSADEPPGCYGMAHLCEHLMGSGTAHCDSNYMHYVSQLGGDTNAWTWEDATSYWLHVPRQRLPAALWLYSDMMGYLVPALTQEDLDQERDVVCNEKLEIDGAPYAKQDSILKTLLYPAEHPYARTIVGLTKDLRTLTMKDVTDYYARYYVPNNASLCIAGDFDPEEAKSLIRDYFGPIPPGPPLDRPRRWIPTGIGTRRALATDRVELPRLTCAWHTPPEYHPGDAEIELLVKILGAGRSSRLHQALIEEQELVHELEVIREPLALGSTLRIQATARAGRTLGEVEQAMDAELRRLLEKGITREELARAQALWETERLRELEQICGFGGRADLLNEAYIYRGDPAALGNGFEEHRSLTVEDVMDCARRYLDLDHRAIVSIVPQPDLSATASDVDRSRIPPDGAHGRFTPPDIQTTTLENGLAVYLVARPGLPLVQAVLVVKSGWAADPAGRPGVANLTGRLLGRGSRSRSAREIADGFDRLGARWEALSTYDFTAFTLNLARRHLREGLRRQAEMLRDPTFSEAELDRLRHVFADRLREEDALPHATPIKMLQKLVFGADHPYAQPYTGSGTTASLRAIERDDLVRFHETHYAPNNCALVLVGDLDLEGARDLARSAYGKWRARELTASIPPPIEPQTRPQIHIIDRPDADQSFLVVGHPGMARAHPDYLAFQVLNDLLGGQYESRINMNLREDKGYTYGYRSVLLSLRHAGMYIGFCSVDTDHTDEALHELLGEFRDIRDRRPIEEAELEGQRTELIELFPDQFASAAEIARQVTRLVCHDRSLESWQAYRDRVAALDLATVQRVAREQLHPESLHILIAGDRSVIEDDVRRLGLGEIQGGL